jgi:NADH:ubiquinone oxidoreductase subunit 4 (subunit M)
MITLAVPGATTFAGELLIIQGAFRGDVSGALVGTIAALAIVLAALYALRLIAAALFTSDDSVVASSAPAHTALGKDLGARELFLVAPALVVLLVLSAWPNALHRAMNEPPVPITLGSEQLPKLEAAEKPTDKKKDHS